MFAIPGILALISFIYVRPQEFVVVLTRAPLLYLFFALALFGLAVDLRLRVTRWRLPVHATVVVGFFLWALTTVAIYSPGKLIEAGIDLILPVTMFSVLALSVQSLRAFRWVATLVVVLSLVLALIAIHQGNAPLGCVRIDTTNASDLSTGEPDGRGCSMIQDCYGSQADPGADYLCEHIGLFGTTSISRRVRYRGILQDPNELALAVSVGWALSFGLLGARRRRYALLVAASGIATAVCVIYSQSRGGMLVLLTVIAVYALLRYRWKGAIAGAVLALPLLIIALSGPERRDGDESAEQRLEAWGNAIDLFLSNPLTGVGAEQFTQHHYLTAHNSYMLAPAELGLPGFFFWLAVLYLSLKTTFTIGRRYRGDPAAQAAVRWSDALFGATCALAVGAFFLSMTYHMLLWIVLGLSAALANAVATHDPKFRIRFTLADAAAILAGCVFLLGFVRLFLRIKGVY